MIKLLEEKNEVYHEWYWTKSEDKTNKEYKKFGYLRIFKELNIFIGIGIYIDDYEKKLKEEILEYIPKIKFGKNGFIFVLNNQGTFLSYPKKNRIGVNVIANKDANGKLFMKEMIEKAKNPSGFTEYVTPPTAVNKNLRKITYSKGYKDWNWVLASGFLIKDLEDKIKEKQELLEIRNNEYKKLVFLNILFIAGTLFLISFLVSKKIEKQFFIYKKKIIEETNKNIEKDRILAQQSKMASLGEMLGNIAHQWRQPLSGISTSSSGLALKIEMGVLEEKDIKESNDTIIELTNYLSKTLDNFTSFFKPEKEKKSFFLKKSIENSLYIANTELKKNNIEIVKDIIDLEIYAYENDMMQILLNLINNAKDALILNKKEGQKYIFINIHKKENTIYIEIKDNGNGIDEKIIDRIFEPYFTTKHTFNGTGIGLYMVKQILNRYMNSDISVINKTFEYNGQKHTGASFTIKLNMERP